MKSIFNTLFFIIKHPLNKKRKINAFIAFIKWQLVARLLNSQFIFKWVDDTKFILQKSEFGMTGNLYCGLMEHIDMLFTLHLLKENDIFYDVGANVGSYTILASGVKKCKTICFEPIPSTYDRLLDNIAINRLTKSVDAKNCGVGDENKILSFINDRDTTNKVSTNSDYLNTTNVNVIRLDDEYNPKDFSIVKVDVEVYEDFVLRGGLKFFSNPKVIALIIELNDSGLSFGIKDSDIHKLILSFGFKPIIYNPFTREISPIKNFSNAGNTIYVKDIDMIQKRCSEAEKVNIHTVGDLII